MAHLQAVTGPFLFLGGPIYIVPTIDLTVFLN
jgi:hypothetical protein